MNEYVGRSYIKAVDAGDTIFVHMFGAYFGLAASRSVQSSYIWCDSVSVQLFFGIQNYNLRIGFLRT